MAAISQPSTQQLRRSGRQRSAPKRYSPGPVLHHDDQQVLIAIHDGDAPHPEIENIENSFGWSTWPEHHWWFGRVFNFTVPPTSIQNRGTVVIKAGWFRWDGAREGRYASAHEGDALGLQYGCRCYRHGQWSEVEDFDLDLYAKAYQRLHIYEFANLGEQPTRVLIA